MRNLTPAVPKRDHCKIYGPANQRKRLKNLKTRMRKLTSDMKEISEEQQNIKMGQGQVRENFEAIDLECERLCKKTKLIMQQSVNTQIRLAFMFQILKARESQEFDKAAQLTCVLRELINNEKGSAKE